MKHKLITLLSLSIIMLFIFISGCKKDAVTEPAKDTEKPTVSILFPAYGSDVKADTTYTVIADANDNVSVAKVEFYINGQNMGSDTLSPYEYRWSTQGLTATQTIMAKAYDEAGNIGTSVVSPVSIKGAANHAPATPSSPSPADSSAGQLLSPTLRWSCSDPDGDALTYDVFFDTSNSPTTQIATGKSATTLARTGLSSSTKYYWKVNAKDNKGATTSGTVWSFATTNPPAVPSNPNPTDATTGVSRTPKLSWSCSDPDGDALIYDVYFGTSSNPTTAIATGQSATSISRSGLAEVTTYYWRIVAKDSKGATTSGAVWSFTTVANIPPTVPSDPFPANAATGISTIPTLRWSCSDADGDPVTYDVFFGTSSNPTTTISTNQSATSINPSGLAKITPYYWRIVAKDSKGATTSGAVWLFTTSSEEAPLGMVAVVGGTFQMGSTTGNSDEKPVHSATVGSFYIDKFEVTYELWTAVRNWGLTNGYTDLPVGQNGGTPSGLPSSSLNNPVTMVNWFDILKWCNARSEKDGFTPAYYTSNTHATVYRTGQLDLAADAVNWTANGCRLPTEAEWEFAARGGLKTNNYAYSGSNTVGDAAWYDVNSGSTTHPVGQKTANELGVYDMSGNVWEWCWDWYGTYSSGAQTDPKGAISGTGRIGRGGSSHFDVDYCRVAGRRNDIPDYRSSHGLGFRCTCD